MDEEDRTTDLTATDETDDGNKDDLILMDK